MARSRSINITPGDRFGRLVIIKETYSSRYGKHSTKRNFICLCDCGVVKTVQLEKLVRRHFRTQSCGCYARNQSAKILFKHGNSGTRLYQIWSAMKSRCFCETDYHYKWYGARGILVFKQWADDYMVFHNWAMSNGYSDGLTIERKNVDGDYCPDNCTWTPLTLQARNTRTNHRITYNGDTRCLAEWSEILGISYSMLSQRISVYGWSFEEAISIPSNFGNVISKIRSGEQVPRPMKKTSVECPAWDEREPGSEG